MERIRRRKCLAESGEDCQVIKFAESTGYEKKHALQVRKIALAMFDELKPLHNLAEKERRLLDAASILHDIGWAYGKKKHNESSRDMILSSDMLPFKKREKLIMALVAGYHRGKLPNGRHKYFSALSKKDKRTVKRLSSFLRIADSLDRSHGELVKGIYCKIRPKTIRLYVTEGFLPEEDRLKAMARRGLFEKTFKRKLFVV